MLCAALTLLLAAEAPFANNEPALVFGRVSTAVVVIRSKEAQGSGVIVAKGQAITNYHVVKKATGLTLTQGGTTVAAKVVRFDEKRDLALVSFEGLDRKPVALGEAKGLKVGDRVYAIGAPHGLELTLSDGLVSSLRDDGKGSAPTVQTTAPISPGSSGGGLFDGRGRLVAVTTYQAASGQNLNFANPAEWVAELLKAADSKPAEPAKALWSVSARPKNLRCEIEERSVWGLFSDGPELLETQPATAEVSFVDFDGQAPRTGEVELALRDLSRKSQFVAFEGSDKQQFFFVFDDDGAIKLIKAEVTSVKGQPRLVTRSGMCSEVDRKAAAKATRQLDVAQGDDEKCLAGDAALCLKLGRSVEGGIALVYFRRACDFGEADGCSGAAALYEKVGDQAKAEQFLAAARKLRPGEPEKVAPAPAAKPVSTGDRRTPLRKN